MALVFVKRSANDDQMMAVALNSGDVLTIGEGGNLHEFDVSNNVATLRTHLEKKQVRIDAIKTMCSKMGLFLPSHRVERRFQ